MDIINNCFDDETRPADPFYSEKNKSQIQKADRQIKDGQVVVCSMDELEAMEAERSKICREHFG